MQLSAPRVTINNCSGDLRKRVILSAMALWPGTNQSKSSSETLTMSATAIILSRR